MTKLDLKAHHKSLFTARRDIFAEITVPPLPYLMVDGHGDPHNSADYRAAVESLFSTAYAIKFAAKADGRDFVVPPLEGLWWADDPADFVARRKDRWIWTMMIMMPDFVDAAVFDTGRAKAVAKRGPMAPGLRLEVLEEGPCLQALHIGPYDAEDPLLADLHDRIMPERGLTFAGHHHEIYLGDPRRTAPDKLRTLLRQPVKKS